MPSDSEHHERHNNLKQRRNKIDWDNLRARSLNPGGFGRDRIGIWAKLLNAAPTERQGEKDPSGITPPDTPPHQDERQITLDTDRSFVLYPVDPEYSREALQTDLRELLVSLFRKRPRLNYFQGYHDIATVLFLTMPEELQLPCIEKLSLHRLRDSMGAGLEPVLGLLRVTKNLIRMRDRAYADILERNSPLPFHALSNLLTLFSHDVPTLPLTQHVFDYLLCRPPIATVYLATAIILSRKQDVLRIEEEGDDGMVHSLLSSLPNLSDGDDTGNSNDSDPPIPTSIDHEQSPLSSNPDPGNTDLKLEFIPPFPVPENDQDVKFWSSQETKHSSNVSCETADMDDTSMDNIIGSTEKDAWAQPDDPSATSENNMATEATSVEDPFSEDRSNPNGICMIPSTDDIQSDPMSISRSPSRDGKPSAPNGVDLNSDEKTPIVTADHTPLVEPTPPQSREEWENVQRNHSQHQRTTLLTDLFREADALYAEFPPSHPDLHLSSIMGPQSVIFTWSESFSELPSDKEAEAMVQHPNLIVYPYIDIEEDSSDSSEYEEEEESKSRWRLKGKERLKVGTAKLKKKLANKKDRKKKIRSPYTEMDKGTIVAGAVLVVGVAVAVYGIKTRSGDTNGLFLSFANTQGHASAQSQDWKRVGGWMSGALSVMGEKVVHAFDSLTIDNVFRFDD